MNYLSSVRKTCQYPSFNHIRPTKDIFSKEVNSNLVIIYLQLSYNWGTWRLPHVSQKIHGFQRYFKWILFNIYLRFDITITDLIKDIFKSFSTSSNELSNKKKITY